MIDGVLQIRGDVYAGDLQKSLQRLAQLSKRECGDIVRERSGMMARYLAQWTMPVTNIHKGATGTPDGGNDEAHQLGMNAVSRDIGRVYMDVKVAMKLMAGLKIRPDVPKSAAVKTVFTRMIKEGRIDRAQKVLRTVNKFASFDVIQFDGGKLHRRSQKNGVVHIGQKPKVVADSVELRKYVEKERKRSGWTKAAWVNAAKQIPGSKIGTINKWITKHNSAPARGFFKHYGKAEAKLTNNVDWVSKKIDDTGAMAAFEINLKKDIDKRIEYILRGERLRNK